MNRVKEYVASSAYSGWNNLGTAIGGLKGTDLRWANPLELKNAVENAFTEKFGAKGTAKPKGKVRPCHSTSGAVLISWYQEPKKEVAESSTPSEPAASASSSGKTLPHLAAIAIGANVGDRFQNIECALRLLEAPGANLEKWIGSPRVVVVDTSFMYETAPMYVEDQPKFINCACMVGPFLSFL